MREGGGSGGRLKFKLLTEPSFFSAQHLDHSISSRSVIAQEIAGDRVVGLGSYRVNDAFVDGSVKRIGYLGGLIIHADHQNSTILKRGYQKIDEFRKEESCHLCITSIFESNKSAQNILTSKRAGLPNYQDIGKYSTFAMNPKQFRKLGSHHVVTQGGDADLPEILKFLSRCGQKRQFFPAFKELPLGLQAEDFFLVKAEERIIGAVALWDQSQYKQWVIQAGAKSFHFLRPAMNLYFALQGQPLLPKPGDPFDQVFLSFLCLEREGSFDILESLFHAIYQHQVKWRPQRTFLIGLHEKDPCYSFFLRLPSFRFDSRFYLVSWGKEYDAKPKRLELCPYLEIGYL